MVAGSLGLPKLGAIHQHRSSPLVSFFRACGWKPPLIRNRNISFDLLLSWRCLSSCHAFVALRPFTVSNRPPSLQTSAIEPESNRPFLLCCNSCWLRLQRGRPTVMGVLSRRHHITAVVQSLFYAAPLGFIAGPLRQLIDTISNAPVEPKDSRLCCYGFTVCHQVLGRDHILLYFN